MVREKPRGDKTDKKIETFQGMDGIKVTMMSPTENPLDALVCMLRGTWGGSPTTFVAFDRECASGSVYIGNNQIKTAEEYIRRALKKEVHVGQCLECINFSFKIENITRAFTHQLVRMRVGAGYSHQGGRDTDLATFSLRLPEIIAANPVLKKAYEETAQKIRETYKLAIENGAPYQDARYIIPMGFAHEIILTINYRALQGWLGMRLCNMTMPETKYVARLIQGEVRKKFPLLGDFLVCGCDHSGKCYARPTLFPPCGKHPTPEGLSDPDQYDFPFGHNANIVWVERESVEYKEWKERMGK